MFYNYPAFVDKSSIESNDREIAGTPYRIRTKLSMSFTNRHPSGKSIAFLMKNPSVAYCEKADKTVRNVTEYVYRLKEYDARFAEIDNIHIVNLYALYATDSKELAPMLETLNEYKDIQEENDQCIIDTVKQSDFVVPAWGKKPKNMTHQNIYKERVLNVLSLLQSLDINKKIYLINHTKKRTTYPIHPQTIGYLTEALLDKFQLVPHNVRKTCFTPKTKTISILK